MRKTLIPVAVFCVLAAQPAGAAEVQYFPVPKGDNPHDVAPAPDGTVWYTGQRAGVLGRLDPKTGQVERIPLGEGSAPHGVIVGPDGAAWVTDSGLNAIARVDPADPRGARRGRCPQDTGRREPQHGRRSIGSGRLWFTGQGGILRPARSADTGDARRCGRRRAGRGPYGIAATPGGDRSTTSSLAGEPPRAEPDVESGDGDGDRAADCGQPGARAGCGPTRAAGSGSATGTPAIVGDVRPGGAAPGACGSSRARRRARTRCGSTTRTRCG